MLHMLQKVAFWIFFVFFLFFLLIKTKYIRVLLVFQRIKSIHETQTRFSLFSNNYQFYPEAVAQTCSVKRCCACNFIKKETLAQVFFCEFCEISKNTFFTEHVWATAFYNSSIVHKKDFIKKETLAQVFSYEFCEISKSTFFTEHVWATVSYNSSVVHI